MDWAGRGEHAPGIIATLTFCGSVCIVRCYHIYNQVNVCLQGLVFLIVILRTNWEHQSGKV